jgi:hypothetical protein
MITLTAQQAEWQLELRAFVDQHIKPVADQMDAAGRTSNEMISSLAARGYLGLGVPEPYGGGGADAVTLGLLCYEITRGSASLLSLMTVQNMVSLAIAKWGTDQQRDRWLPALARGETIGAFALSEPNTGSDARSVETTAAADGDALVINGRKRWCSFGQTAGLYLVLCQYDGKPTALLVERGTPGLDVRPMDGLLGFRAAMLGELVLTDCRVPATNLVGRPGFGFSHVMGSALDAGRYSIAWGCTGICQECLDLSLDYSSSRVQGGKEIGEHQLIQQMIANMITDTKASYLMCLQSGLLRDAGEPASIMETSTAKYFASRAAVRIASDALQIHGANGCLSDSPVQRHFRDARLMEIIEGSSQIQQIIIARSGSQSHRAERS